MNQEIAAQHDSSASEVVILKQRCTDLAQQLSDSQASLNETRQKASGCEQQYVTEKTALADKLEAQQVCPFFMQAVNSKEGHVAFRLPAAQHRSLASALQVISPIILVYYMNNSL